MNKFTRYDIPFLWRIPLLVVVLLLFANNSGVSSLAIDNEVVGLPSVQCSENAIQFSVRTRNVFRGNIYIKGQYGAPQCRQEYFQNDFNGATFSIRISDCGMRRIRQLQPHGMNYMLVFVTNFHPQFVTKVDRAYNVRCFYAQADKTVTAGIDVSMLTTQSLEQSTLLAPNCEYSVRQGQLNGPRVRHSEVGDRLVHRWECDNPNFGMLVKNCFVSDGSGSSVRILDSRGCPVFTPVIQGPLQYDTSLNLAYVEVWAYKFPDKPSLYFQCQIQICNKRDNECLGVTPPNCPRVLKNNFEPNSLVNPNTNPVNVIGNFGPRTGSLTNVDPNANRIGSGGNFIGTNTNPVNPVVSSVRGSGGYPNTGALTDRSGYNPAQPQVDPNSYSGSRIGAGGYGSSGTAFGNQVDNSYGTNTGARFGTQVDSRNSGLQPTRPYARDAPPDRRNRQLAIDSGNATSQSSARRVRRRRAVTNEIDMMRFLSKQQAERMQALDPVLAEEENDVTADETFDIVADPVYITDQDEIAGRPSEEPESAGSRFSPFATTPARRWPGDGRRRAAADNEPAVCLNEFGVGLLMSCFSVLVVLLCALLCYVLVQSIQRKKRAADDVGLPPSTSNAKNSHTHLQPRKQQSLWDAVRSTDKETGSKVVC